MLVAAAATIPVAVFGGDGRIAEPEPLELFYVASISAGTGSIYPETAEASAPDFGALDALYHPGETVAIEAIVAAAGVERVRELGGSLTEAEARAVLTVAGWPAELHEQALAVSWCESKWSPHAVGDGGNSLGWFQLNVATWFGYAGEDPALWADPVVNARVAWATYQYDLSRGYQAWAQWSCRTAVR